MSLTDTSDVKEQLKLIGNEDDAYLGRLITVADAIVNNAIGREFEDGDFTDYLDGTGTRRLFLPQGPLNTVTSVSWVTYDSDRNETLDQIDDGEFFLRGLTTEKHNREGWLESNGWSWTRGQRNIKVVYNAGFATVPEDVQQVAIDIVSWFYNQRKSSGLYLRDIGAGTKQFRPPPDMYDFIRAVLTPYGAF